jgi:hypothetical protein
VDIGIHDGRFMIGHLGFAGRLHHHKSGAASSEAGSQIINQKS